MTNPFSPWFSLTEHNLYPKVRLFCGEYTVGTYQVIVVDAEEVHQTIRRLLGDDHEGLVYIGASINLPNRMASLRKATCGNYGHDGYVSTDPHTMARKLNPAFKAVFPLTAFRVRVKPI